MPRALRSCPTPGCPGLTTGGQCPTCRAKAEQARGTRHQRGYDYRHETRFRQAVLKADPLCVCTEPGHGHTGQCRVPSTVADHHPRSRKELVALGLDPYDPQYGRGLCEGCHNPETAKHQPGGWHATQSR